LIKALTTLMKRGKKFDHVLIETTGLADPAPVAFVSALRPRASAAPRAHLGF
jgi:G3E family GTPase